MAGAAEYGSPSNTADKATAGDFNGLCATINGNKRFNVVNCCSNFGVGSFFLLELVGVATLSLSLLVGMRTQKFCG